MKTQYLSSLKSKIENCSSSMKKAQAALIPVKRDLWTWAEGTAQHASALKAKAQLDKQIADYKKEIADAKRWLKNPEIIRRNKIAARVRHLLWCMDLDGDAVIRTCLVNDHVGGKVYGVSEKEKEWGVYAKSSAYANFPKIWHNIDVQVDPNWDRLVDALGLAMVGGMLTLSAKPAGRFRKALALAKTLDVELFEAIWLRKGRGFNVVQENGFIAVKRTRLGLLPMTAYHSASPMTAVEGAHRKFQNLDLDALPIEQRDVPADAVATWADAEAVGACIPGVKAWCDKVGINHRQESVLLIDVVRAYYQHPAPEAKAIILRVLRQYPRKAA